MHDRLAMQKRPPHILVTTPESLYILLTAGKSREMLRTVSTLIVDEIHAVADDKRGTHLALSLERLEALTAQPLTRIGLSATQKPIELVGQFLTGSDRPAPVIVRNRAAPASRPRYRSSLQRTRPHRLQRNVGRNLSSASPSLVQQHRSTLIFVNTRRLAERVAHHLARAAWRRCGRLASWQPFATCGASAVESKLKAGEIRALVATASLELGIDIGTVDLVCQIGSPRSISVALAARRTRRTLARRDSQVPFFRHHARRTCWNAPRWFAPFVTENSIASKFPKLRWIFSPSRSWPPAPPKTGRKTICSPSCAARILIAISTRKDFDEIVAMLSDGIAARRGRYGAYLHRDQVNHRLRGRRGSRLAAITSGGAIPDNALYTVVAEPEGTSIGTVDEDFAVESLRGDIILPGKYFLADSPRAIRVCIRRRRKRRASQRPVLAWRSSFAHDGAFAAGRARPRKDQLAHRKRCAIRRT